MGAGINWHTLIVAAVGINIRIKTREQMELLIETKELSMKNIVASVPNLDLIKQTVEDEASTRKNDNLRYKINRYIQIILLLVRGDKVSQILEYDYYDTQINEYRRAGGHTDE